MSALPAARSAAARICSLTAQPSTIRTLQRPLYRCLVAPVIPQRLQACRSYVSQSKKNNAAQVNLDTEIRLEKEHFVSETGRQPGDVHVPGIDADAMMSPTAGTSS